jgi:hypothetical protein
MKSPISVPKKQTTSFRIVSLMLAIAPLWLMLATANTSQAQTTSSHLRTGRSFKETTCSAGIRTRRCLA